MAVKAQWSFDHLPTNLAIGPASLNYLGIPGMTNTADSDPGGNAGGRFGIQAGALFFGVLYSSYYSGGTTLGTKMLVPLTNLQDLTKPHAVIGFRFTPAILVASNIVRIVTGSSTLVLAAATDAALGLIAGKTYFIEIVFDRPNTQFMVYVNNALKKTVFYDPTQLGSTSLLVFGIDSVTGNSNGNSFVYRDFLFIDDTQDSTPCTRQGPGTARPAVLATASAAGWTSSDSATPLADLTTPLTTSMLSTPNITGPASQAPIQATFVTSADPALKIVAASVLVSSSNSSANNGVLNGQWSLNGQNQAAGQVTYPDNTMQWSKVAALSSAAPDGAAWTVAKLQAAQFAATPAGS